MPGGQVSTVSAIWPALWRSTGRPQFGAVRRPRPRVQQPQIVVDLGDRPDGRPRVVAGVFCSMAIAGDSPSIASTSGFSMSPRNCRAYADNDSTYRRCPSA